MQRGSKVVEYPCGSAFFKGRIYCFLGLRIELFIPDLRGLQRSSRPKVMKIVNNHLFTHSNSKTDVTGKRIEFLT